MKHTNITLDCLCYEIKRLRKENKKLHDKHWEECRQIALYDAENKSLRGALSQAFEMIADLKKAEITEQLEKQEVSAEQPEAPAEPEPPKKTYKQDFLEKFPKTVRKPDFTPVACRDDLYGIIGECAGRRCKDCWNEVMPDDSEKGKD